MTQQEARTELKQIRAYCNRISERKQRLAELRSSLNSVRTVKYSACSSRGSAQEYEHRLASAIDRATKLEIKISDDIVSMAEAKQRIVEKVEQLPEPYSTVLTKRYVHLQRFEKIAMDMNYTCEWIRHLDSASVKKYAAL